MNHEDTRHHVLLTITAVCAIVARSSRLRGIDTARHEGL
ncbi:hypothetical protein SSE37_10278 [Sagittula stellata E-37]|uniref:Uncharacterized protein n=1 Tax=Sagittula stellata (strain ATCC 700073 / DSM 11524 / E-37) TaxID=388399 RepID=A3K8F6_SAGS3|nr:hypothetical protein SSE37_10278 [Sagittula stellata E-37]